MTFQVIGLTLASRAPEAEQDERLCRGKSFDVSAVLLRCRKVFFRNFIS